MSRYPGNTGPMCPICAFHRIKNRGSRKCAACNRKPGWHTTDEGVALIAKGLEVEADPPAPVDRTPSDDVALVRAQESARRYKKLYNTKIKESAEEERLIELFDSAIASMAPIPRPLRSAPIVSTSRKRSKYTPVLAFGDLHVGQVISQAATHGINEYNFSIWQDRLEYLERSVLDILLNHQISDYSEIVVAGIGDNVSGRIHEELQKYGAQHVIDQVFVGATAAACFLQRIAAHFPKLRYIGISGNHGRLDKAKESSQYFKNFDYLWNAIIATRLAGNRRVSIEIPEAIFTVIEVAKHKILISHGMELPPASMGLPAYSINRASGGYQELLRMVGEHYDYWLLGHIHRPMELDTAIVNGSFPGYDEYAIGRLFKPIRPMQKLIGFHERHGKAWEYPIRLDAAPKAKIYKFAHDMGAVEALEVAEGVSTT